MFKPLLLTASLLIPVLAFAQGPAPAAKPAPESKTTAPAEKAAPPKVLFKTTLGDITVELYPDKAPKTVENVLEYVRSGFYDGTIFHRVIGNFMIQGGGFTQDLKQKQTRAPVANEANNGLSNLRGTIAMARTGDPHSATAQFFINVVDNRNLDYVSDQSPMTWGYTVFGKVVSGLDVVDKIKAVQTGAQGPFRSDVPATAVVIEKAEVVQ